MANESMFLVRSPKKGRSILSVPVTAHFGVQYAIERAEVFCRDFPEVTLYKENEFGKMQIVPEWISEEERRRTAEQERNKRKKNVFRHN